MSTRTETWRVAYVPSPDMTPAPFITDASGGLTYAMVMKHNGWEKRLRLMVAAPELLAGLLHAIHRRHEFSRGCDGCLAGEAAIAAAEGR